MKSFHLQVLAAERVFYDGPCQSLTVPTIDGMYGVMAHHENVVIAIVPGIMTLHTDTGEEQIAAGSEGLLKVESDEALLLVDTAEHPDEIDLRRAEETAAAAKEALLQKRSAQEHALAAARMARALSRAAVKQRDK